jgi:SpoVK/Ycf46/Vps4 family AAA+-type ATPase
LVADSRAAVEGLLLAVDEFENDLNHRVLVFHNGCWKHDEEMWEDIQNSQYDNLILEGDLAETIREDVQNWINAKELYGEHNLPWKRGLILVGPPGNGKTHFIKATLNHFGLNTLYVRNFSEGHEEDEDAIQSIFARARKCAPCLLILEDLDSLVTSGNRSYFLNELDGFARNDGICMIASANDPGKLDPALVSRPSRFDRRYVFGLPAPKERARYVRMMVEKLTPQNANLDFDAVAAETKDFSFAYLKELVLSSLMAWLSGGQKKPFAEVISSTAAILREQMEAVVPDDEEGPPAKARPSWTRRRNRPGPRPD